MKIYRMNENDFVLHNSFEEAKNHYDNVTGVFEEYEDDNTGEEFEVYEFVINVNEEGDEPLKMTVKEALEQELTELPCIYCYEY